MIHLNIGSNLNSTFGNRFDNISKAVNLLIESDFKVKKNSNFYETPSYPNKNLPKFLNVGILGTFDNNYKEFLYARLDHILLDYDSAKKKYSNIALDTNTYLISQYWLKRIILEESVLEEYDKMEFNNFYHKNLF